MNGNPLGIILLAAVLIGAWFLVKNDNAGASDFGRWDDGTPWRYESPCTPSW